MKIISIALKDLLITLKDKKALALIILMPIVLIMVLGMALSPAFQSSGISVRKFEVALCDKDGGEYAGHFKEFLGTGDIKKMIALREMEEDEAMEKVRSGEIPALVVIPEGYSKAVANGTKTTISIYGDPGSPLRSQIVESLVKSYTGVGSAVQAAAEAAQDVFKDYNLDGSMIVPEVVEFIDNGQENVEFQKSDLKKRESLSSMQYYSAAMLVMYILFVGMIGTTSIMEEREQKTLQRVMSTATSNSTIIVGKIFGVFLLGVLDVSILVLFTRLAFGVKWGDSPAGLILLSAAMIFAACGFAVLIATIFRTSKAVDSVNPAIIMVMSFLGGSMFPIMQMPPVLQAISKTVLNNWALRGYLNLMMGNGINSIAVPSIVLLAMGTVFLTAGIYRLKLQ